jgi:tripartite-type tricarboxylate transporter receptor subunit TctC
MTLQLTSGVLAPAGTPDDIVARLAAATAIVIADQDFQRVLATSGLEGRSDNTAPSAKAFWQSERERLTPIMKTAGLRPS